MEKRGKKIVVGLEIFLMVTMTFAISYEIGQGFTPAKEVQPSGNGIDFLFSVYKEAVKLVWGDKNLVTAALDDGVYTCIQAKNGSICVQYNSGMGLGPFKCNSDCTSNCNLGPKSSIQSCQPGTCYYLNSSNQACGNGVIKIVCENAGGSWIDNPTDPSAVCINGTFNHPPTANLDVNPGHVYTCPVTKSGSICQEIAVLTPSDAQKCNDVCTTNCIPSSRDQVSSCKLGTCYDPVEGTCQTNSPKAACENFGGNWLNDSYGNVIQCRKGCCNVGDEALFITQQQCTRQQETGGVKAIFNGEVRDEISCLITSNKTTNGACVIEQDFERTCKFTSASDCLQKGGEFHESYLCSNPTLNTTCQKQQKAACVDGKDEIYWFDSCGNQENIYDANRVKSWNNGIVLSKNESCSFSGNKKTCGNCNYLAGSTCGAKTATESLSDSSLDVVCRDLSCVDENGKKRANGESWCRYDSAIGVDDPKDRSTDTAGSRHFREVCANGEVRSEPCEDYRNGICVESQTPLPTGVFSTAACILNPWQECIQANINSGQGSADEANLLKSSSCSKNEDCFLKSVNISANFKFNVCVPKYPEGFDMTNAADNAQKICSFASQKCTVVYVKGWGGWSCKSNCECATAAFPQKMNDFCMSLGDCGAKANYLGDVTENYEVSSTAGNAPKVGQAYLNGVKAYANLVPGKYATTSKNITQLLEEMGIPGGLGQPGDVTDPTAGMGTMGMIAGAAGASLMMFPVTIASYGGYSLGLTTSAASSATLSAFGGAAAGAAIGFAVVSLFYKFTGVGRGVSAGEAYAMMALGAIGGGLAGFALTSGSAVSLAATASSSVLGAGGSASAAAAAASATSAAAAAPGATAASVGAAAGSAGGAGSSAASSAVASQFATASAVGMVAIVVIIIVVIYMILSWVMGIGKVKKVTYSFSCQPWQAPTGGDKCSQCGKNGLPCSRYQCETLGQTCAFLNEGTTSEICADIGPNDPNAPTITPNYDVLSMNILSKYSYGSVSDSGFKIDNNETDGCIKSYMPVTFGIITDKPAQCKIDTTHTTKFDDMANDFGGSNLFEYNHTMSMAIPSIESLGLPGYDPNRRADYSMYIRCQDKRGNKNEKEYTINFCVAPGNDLTPPQITAREPAYPYLEWNATQVNASVYTNEPSDCKWSFNDTNYDLMPNNLSCANDIVDQEPQGWKCNFMMPIGENLTLAYIRCKDQPWLVEGVNGTAAHIVVDDGTDENGVLITRNVSLTGQRQRNVNTESYPFGIIRSAGPLHISSIVPNNETIYVGVEPASVELKVTTEGGVDGTATCLYGWGGQMIMFGNTFGTEHSQVFQAFFKGNYNIPIRCEDNAGNVATDAAIFTLDIDRQSPQIARVYRQNDYLNLVTDETATCSYKISGDVGNECSFPFENGTLTSDSGNIHSMPFDISNTYYIKCKDQFGNVPGDCSIVAKGSKFS